VTGPTGLDPSAAASASATATSGGSVTDRTPAVERSTRLAAAGRFFFKHRDLLSPAVLIALLVVSEPGLPFGGRPLDRSLDALGVLLATLGQALRAAVIGYAYIARGGKNRAVHADTLVTSGLFATSRNPLYVGNVLIYAGLMAVWNSPLMYLIAGPFFLLMYRSIVAAEEEFLSARFGVQYERYRREVPRWIPDLRRLRGALGGLSFNWRRVVLKDYGTAAAWLLSTGLFMIIERLHNGPYPGRAGEVATLAAAMSLVVALWGYARWLKRTKRLRA
jgi:protein-S-isoprenylcysteine O-methyltransferase Ste14